MRPKKEVSLLSSGAATSSALREVVSLSWSSLLLFEGERKPGMPTEPKAYGLRISVRDHISIIIYFHSRVRRCMRINTSEKGELRGLSFVTTTTFSISGGANCVQGINVRRKSIQYICVGTIFIVTLLSFFFFPTWTSLLWA